jgi:hypothetical protein
MGLFDFVKDPAGEIADEVKDGTEVVLGNIGTITVAAVEGAVVATKQAVRGKETQIISAITIVVLVYASFKLLQSIYQVPFNAGKMYNP